VLISLVSIFVLGCAAVETPDPGIHAERLDKLGQLQMAMVKVKTGSVDEIAKLKTHDAEDRAKVMALLETLRNRLELLSKDASKTSTNLDNLDMVVIPELRAQAANYGKGLDAIESELNRTLQAHNATLEASDARAMVLSDDYDKILALAQHVADTIHHQDAMHAAAAMYGEVSDRVGYAGDRLREVCNDRGEMTQAIASLMGHLEEARQAEADYRASVVASFDNYTSTLRAEQVDLSNSLQAHDNQLIVALARRSNIAADLAALQGEQAKANTEVQKLEAFLDHMTTVLEDRLLNILRVTNMCDETIHSITVLKVKAHVRSVSMM